MPKRTRRGHFIYPHKIKRTDYAKPLPKLKNTVLRYGHYYGPGRSGGKDQDSIDYRNYDNPVMPIDKVDEYAMYHDADYAEVQRKYRKVKQEVPFGDPDLRDADFEFARSEATTGTIRGLAGTIGVGLQGAARAVVGFFNGTKRMEEEFSNQKLKMVQSYKSFPRPTRYIKKDTGDTAVGTREYYGAIAGKHTAIMGISSIPPLKSEITRTIGGVNNVETPQPDSIIFEVALALFRKIAKREFGVQVQSIYQTMQSIAPVQFHTQANTVDNNTPWINITFYKTSTTVAGGTITTMEPAFTVIGTATPTYNVNQVVCEIANGLISSFCDYNTVNTLVGYTVTKQEHMGALSTDSTSRSVSALRRLDNMIVQVKSTTRVRIQNVSKGSGSETTDIEGNPLVGKVYHFTDPYPINNPIALDYATNAVDQRISGFTSTDNAGVAPNGRSILNFDKNRDGLVIPKTAIDNQDIGLLRHIPPPSFWKNVKGYSPFKIGVGEIMTHRMKFTFDGYINRLFQGLRYWRSPNELQESDMTDFLGTFDMFCFEDYMQPDTLAFDGATGNMIETSMVLQVNYQLNRCTSVRIKKFVQKGLELVRDYSEAALLVNPDYKSDMT